MFAQESVMEIQKQKNLYLAKLLEQEVIKQDEFEDLVFKPEINAFHSNYLSSRFMDNINFGWSAWQAAKAQAVPEGFVLVSKDRIVKAINKIEILFEEDPLLALGELLSIQQDLNTMIEAQEQGHD